MDDRGSIGWCVDCVQSPEGGLYFFADQVSTADMPHATFAKARIAITT